MRLNPTENPATALPAARRRITLPATFRAFRHRNYLLWFIGQGISLSGTWMQTMAQQVLVYRLTGSAVSLGIISFIGLIPLVPLSLWGGSIVDRLPKRNVILVNQVIALVQAMVLAWLTLSGQVQIWHVYLMAFILGAVNAVDMPARQAFTVDMVGKEDLTNAIGLNSAMFNGARALGPALAGVVVAATGEGMAFFWNGLSFVAVIFCLLLMRGLPESSKDVGNGESPLQHMAGGMRFVLSNRIILVVISLIAVSAFLSMPYSTLMPVFAEEVLKDSAQPVIAAICGGENMIAQCQSPEALPLGILMSMVGVGAVIGALCVASLHEDARRGRLLTAGNLAFPAILLAFAFSRSFTLSLGLMLLTGFSFVWQNALANTILQLITPNEVRGRVMGVYTLTFQAMMRLGGLQAGVLTDWLGASLSVGLGAAVSLAYGLAIAWRFPKLRRL